MPNVLHTKCCPSLIVWRRQLNARAATAVSARRLGRGLVGRTVPFSHPLVLTLAASARGNAPRWPSTRALTGLCCGHAEHSSRHRGRERAPNLQSVRHRFQGAPGDSSERNRPSSLVAHLWHTRVRNAVYQSQSASTNHARNGRSRAFHAGLDRSFNPEVVRQPLDHVSCHGLVPPTCPQRSPAPHPRRFTLELVGDEQFFVHRPSARIPDRSGQTRGANGTFTSLDWAEKIALSTGLPHDSACLCTRCPHVVHRPCLRRQGAHVRESGSTYKHVVLPTFRRERG